MGLLNDFETGKSIRIFSGRNFIINSIKQTIEKKTFDLLDKKSGCLAKQGAVIAIIGSFLAFFVYLFIGLKCYIGLFSIGELTRYISGFMQIIQGGVLIANGIGQIIYLNNITLNSHAFKILLDVYFLFIEDVYTYILLRITNKYVFKPSILIQNNVYKQIDLCSLL